MNFNYKKWNIPYIYKQIIYVSKNNINFFFNIFNKYIKEFNSYQYSIFRCYHSHDQ